ncbi:MAG: DUF2096 family protein [Methanocella sp.]|jgi:hypothetical protein
MGHNLVSWKLLEDMVLELKKAGTTIPARVIEDLRSAKAMIQLTYTEGSHGTALQKAEEYLSNVEAYVVTEAQSRFGVGKADQWLRQLEQTGGRVTTEPVAHDKFVSGVPRNQQFVRIEPSGDLTAQKVQTLAKEYSMQVNLQPDNKIVVYGSAESLKRFLRRIAEEKPKL